MRPWFVVLLLVLLPGAHAAAPGIHNDPGPAQTTLYLHGRPLGPDGPPMALNLQEPAPQWTLGTAAGLAAHTQTCAESPVGAGNREVHTWYAVVLGGRVEYDPEGPPRFQAFTGVAQDLRLDTAAPVRLVWYLEGALQEQPVPLVAPQVVVRATLREGALGERATLDAGRTVAHGETGPALLAGPATDHPAVRYIPVEADGGTRHVYEFTLDLPYAEPGRDVQVPASEGLHLRVEASVQNPACDGGSVTPGALVLHSSDGHRPRFTWGVLDAVRITMLSPRFEDGRLWVDAEAESPWGRYDLDEGGDAGMTLTVEGPATPSRLEREESQRHLCCHMNSPHMGRLLTWTWDHEAEEAPPGLYEVRLTVDNLQGSARSVAHATFEVGSGRTVGCTADGDGPRCTPSDPAPSQESPGAGLPLALGALAALAALRRRS